MGQSDGQTGRACWARLAAASHIDAQLRRLLRHCSRKETALTYVITQPCIDTLDQSCVDVCPVDCIHFEEGADRKLYIDPDECIDCGACEPACPVSAIFAEADVPEDQAVFTEIDALWFKDRAAARAMVPDPDGVS